MSNRNLRTVLRVLHLLTAFVIVLYFYSPLGSDAGFATIARIILPVLTLTGIAMWQQPALSKLFRGTGR
jgi:thiosulfate reductase cytochrome b subunit